VALGLGTGFNNLTALFGVSAKYRIIKKLSVQGGMGLGGWGYKFSIGLKYGEDFNGGWSLGIGYSVCPGENNIKVSMEDASGVSKEVTINYLTASTINLVAERSWKIGRKNTFYMDFGYAIAMQSTPWKVVDNTALSDASKSAIKMIQPGGIILGLGFNFGL
jgi:hypothetical protein